MRTIDDGIAKKSIAKQFRKKVRAGKAALFEWFEDLARPQTIPTLRKLFSTWFHLLATDVIQEWLLNSDWAKTARDNGDTSLSPVLSLLLRRHLLREQCVGHRMHIRRDAGRDDEASGTRRARTCCTSSLPPVRRAKTGPAHQRSDTTHGNTYARVGSESWPVDAVVATWDLTTVEPK